MRKTTVAALANGLLYVWSLDKLGWRFVWNGRLRGHTIARCNRPERTIELRPGVELLKLEEVKELILHEIAHALSVGHHNAGWRRMCKIVGATGEKIPAAVWKGVNGGGERGVSSSRRSVLSERC